jgi:DNA-binding IclR family transcriptional regulator
MANGKQVNKAVIRAGLLDKMITMHQTGMALRLLAKTPPQERQAILSGSATQFLPTPLERALAAKAPGALRRAVIPALPPEDDLRRMLSRSSHGVPITVVR